MSSIIVRGWLTEGEQSCLRRIAFGKDVLEIGSYEGLSTLQLAMTAKSVTAVDPFTAKPGGTLDTFTANLKAGQVWDRITVRQGLSADVLPTLDRKYDLIFIDGDHSYDAVKLDIALSIPLLNPDGLLAFHDYSQENLGVVCAINEFRALGAFAVHQTDTIVVISPVKLEIPVKKPVIYLVMPHRSCECHLGAAAGLHFASKNKLDQIVDNYGTSVLPQTFNELFSRALNARDKEGATHFAMLHNDVIPDRGWLDIAFEEMQAQKLDMLSAVVPLKSDRGLTSTGVGSDDNPYSVRRLTMTEVMDLPETFTAKDVPFRKHQEPLLCNTGCWLMKLDEPWVQGLHFRQQDNIVFCLSRDKWMPQSVSEDWDFSRQLHARGCRVAVTRKIPLYHERAEWHNKSAWGDWIQDEEFLKLDRMVAEWNLKQESENGRSSGIGRRRVVGDDPAHGEREHSHNGKQPGPAQDQHASHDGPSGLIGAVTR